MIELRSVTKTYEMGSEVIYAVRNADMTVESGEFIAVTGPSGSGKTTLANIIGGLDRPDSGDVIVDDIRLSALGDRALSAYRNRKVGFVFQTFNLQPGYTAIENTMLPLVFAKVPHKERRRIAGACLDAVGLADRINHKPWQLSGGQRQRVGIARALSCNPEIFIADEPTGNLDTRTGGEIVGLLRRLNKEKGITIIVITHDPDVAEFAGRIVRIHDGRILQTVEE